MISNYPSNYPNYPDPFCNLTDNTRWIESDAVPLLWILSFYIEGISLFIKFKGKVDLFWFVCCMDCAVFSHFLSISRIFSEPFFLLR